ncbi:MAG TPA: hypothetical protein VGE26_03905 [Sphingobacteriaceae bacterium]
MKKIVLVTYEDQGKYTSNLENEDQKLQQFLQDKGLEARSEVWSDPSVDWGRYDVAILKSPWDYFDRILEFYAWLDRMKAMNIRMLNPINIVLWNSDKHYLKDIAAAGLPVTPTLFIEKGETPDLHHYFEEFDTGKLIVKPSVSGGSKNTFKLTREDTAEYTPKLTSLLSEEAFMVQPFLHEVQKEGEWSLLFFNGKYSHSLLKKAKAGDFRVQHYLGGTIHAQEPPVDLICKAREYVDQFAPNCLYARVDGVVVNSGFQLMELELIEPFLFMFTNPNSYEKYYQALKEMI